MKTFIIDENLPRTIKFSGAHKFIHVADIGKQMTDTEIWAFAKENDFIIITKDTDFYNRIILYGAPPRVIWLRLGNVRRKFMEDKIKYIWDTVSKMIEEYELIEIHDDKIEGLKLGNSDVH